MDRIYNAIIETIGHTPLVKLNRVTVGLDAPILLKCEFFNPLGSLKDRIGLAMVVDAEKQGGLKKGTVITECVQVANDDAFIMARRLAKKEGILAGISSGANLWAAMEVAKLPENKGKQLVTLACSTGERYLSTALAAEATKELQET